MDGVVLRLLLLDPRLMRGDRLIRLRDQQLRIWRRRWRLSMRRYFF
jgi:hypothetical protein